MDGHIMIWKDFGKVVEQDIVVTDERHSHSAKSTENWGIMAIVFMSLSRRLAVASADRKITFFKTNGKKFDVTPVSRIENLYAVPLCLEYYECPKNLEDNLKKDEQI